MSVYTYILISAIIFIMIIFVLVAMLLGVKAKLLPSGPVKILINEEKEIEVDSGSTLLSTLGDNKVFHVIDVGAVAVLRGLRALSDFEYEFQMAGINTRLSSDFETIFLMASENQQFVASRFVKEIHSLGGDVSSFVPKIVMDHLESKKK